MPFPRTAQELYVWNGALTGTYVLLALAVDLLYRDLLRLDPRYPLTKPADWLFNGATFAASAMIAVGIAGEKVMALIGDTTSYLVLVGIAGLLYSLQALLPPTQRYRAVPAHLVR